MRINTKTSLFKRLLKMGYIALLILGFGISTSSSWAFSRYFPDNTVYTIHEFESGFHGGDTGAWGATDELFIVKEVFTFMANGTFTGTYSNDDQLNRLIGDSLSGNNTFLTTYTPDSGASSGTYSVAVDGTLTVTFNPGTPDEETITGTLSENGQTVIFMESEYNDSEKWSSFGIGVGVKKGSGFSSSFPDDTVYTIHEFGSGFYGGDDGAWGDTDMVFTVKATLTFMSNGTFTEIYTNDDELNRHIGDDLSGNNTFVTTVFSTSGTSNGTYVIAADGTLTVIFYPGIPAEETMTGTLSGDGQTVIFMESKYNNSDKDSYFGIGVGVKKGSGFSSSFPDNTAYTIHEFESGFHGGDTGAWGVNDELFIVKEIFTFMTNGTFTGSYSNDDQLNRHIGDDLSGNNTFLTTYTPDSGTGSGTYAITADGTISLTFDPGTPDEETITGTLSENGQTVIFMDSEYNDNEKWSSFGFGVGVKSIVVNNGALPSILLLLLSD